MWTLGRARNSELFVRFETVAAVYSMFSYDNKTAVILLFSHLRFGQEMFYNTYIPAIEKIEFDRICRSDNK